MNDNQFRAAVFQRFMEGHKDSSAKEIAKVANCHESHVYAYLRSRNQFAADGIKKLDSYRGNRKLHVFAIDDALFREMLTFLLSQYSEAFNLFFHNFQEKCLNDERT